MKTTKQLLTGIICLLSSTYLFSQDFSNKGKDFWVAYGYHQVMTTGNSQQMVLYFATEFTTTVTVSIPGVGYSVTYPNIPANTVFTSAPLPKIGAQDARLLSESVTPENKGIHITADRPIVAYAHIYNASVSGATILFPTNTLGKEYYSLNYKNVSNTANANCWMYVVATDTGTTTVEITPSANTINHPAGVPFTVDLQQGQVYNIMGQITSSVDPFSSVDLTGTVVRSLATSTGNCKKIGVFSGSGRISISCDNLSSSSDNYMVQVFPKSAWGRRYLTAPTGSGQQNNFFRILIAEPGTLVTVNGSLPGPLINGSYYEIGPTSVPNYIVANNPVMVAQYTTSQGECGNASNPGDPEEIILSPIEQNINKVLWNATPNNAIGVHYVNVIIPNTGTAMSSFRIDGATPISSFTNHPNNPAFAYLVEQVSPGPHSISSDSGFNAIAYGFGNAESYGYNAGSNIKDLYQFISIQNPWATVNFPAACNGSPFFFAIVLPYQPLELQWQFGPALNAMGIPDLTITNPLYDSTWTVNGKQVYRYKILTPYTINASGTYPIKVIAQNPTPDGCGNMQEIEYDLQVFDPPTASFNFMSTGCVTSPVQFFDATNSPRPITQWQWDFGDATQGSIMNPTHTYSAPAVYNVSLAVITDVGCISQPVIQQVDLTTSPIAKFGHTQPTCVGRTVTFTDSSSVNIGSLVEWTWNYGDGSPLDVQTTPIPRTHVYATAGTYNATLTVKTATGCVSVIFSKPITINAVPDANFNIPGICLPSGMVTFTNTSTIPGGAPLTYFWDFGNTQTSTLLNPSTVYTSTGPFNVTLIATASSGCADTITQAVTQIYAQPNAQFTVDSVESCFGGTFNFTDQSSAANSTISQWFWDFGDATTSTLQNPTKQYAAPGTYTVTLYTNSAAGCRSDTATMQVTVLQLPTVSFTASNLLCATEPVQLTSTSVPNAGVITQYAWTVNSTSTGGNNQVITYVPPSAGTYLVGLTVTTDKGCVGQTTGNITVNPRPLANFTIPNICLPAGNATFTNTSTISDGSALTYLWDFGNTQTSTLQNPSTTYTSTGPYNVSLTVTASSGCSHDTIKAITTIYAQPTAAFTSSGEACFGSPITFTDQSTAPNSTVTQWLWDFGDATTSTLQNPSKTYSAPGSYTVTLTITSAAGCVSTVATGTVTVNRIPTADFNLPSPACMTRNITFTDASNANSGVLTEWRWNFGDGNNVTVFNGNPVSHVYANAGTYNVTLQVVTDKGCISTVTTKPITIHILPDAGFIPPEACISDVNAPFTDTSRIASGNIAAWEWNFGDPNATAANPNVSFLQNTTHNYTVVGSYTATLVVTSNNGCTDTTTRTFVVNGSVPQANFTVQNASTLCSNDDVTIVDASTVDFGSLIRVEIYWDYLNDPTIKTVDLDPAAGKNYTHTYPEFGTPTTRTYTVRMVAYSGMTCLHVRDQTITLLATPTLQFNPIPEICEDAPAFTVTQASALNASVIGGSGVYSGNGVTSTGFFDPNVSGIGAHTLTYTYTGDNGCVNSITQQMGVNPTPIANAGPDKVVLEGGTVLLTPALNSGFPVTYLWTPPTSLNDPTRPDASSSPQADITYTLTVTSDKGCATSDEVFVKLLLKPLIPNIFSPNGDGVHDKWEVSFLDTYPGCTVEIYNRYGQIVFKSTGYSNPWDGKVNGKDVPIGTYYYIIDPKNNRAKMTGYVDVIR